MSAPKKSRDPRLATRETLVALLAIESGPAKLLNLSTAGACIEVEGEVEDGQAIELKLAHPRLKVAPSIPGEVAWLRRQKGAKRRRFGVRFVEPDSADVAVRPFLTAEAGSCLFQEDALVGFVVPHGGKRVWSLFDADGKRLAVAAEDAEGLEVHAKTKRAGSLPSFRAASLREAAEMSIGVDGALRPDPPLEAWDPVWDGQEAETPAEDVAPSSPDGPAPRDAKGRPVQGPAGALGFLCETVLPDSWLVVDVEAQQVAYIAGSGEAGYQICSMGEAIDDELEFRVFPDLEHALAVTFGLPDAVGEIEIGEAIVIGQTTQVLVEDSSSSVDLQPGAVQVAFTDYPVLQGPPRQPPLAKPKPAQRKAPPRTSNAANKTLVVQGRRRLHVVLAFVAVLALGGYLAHALWQLVYTYTS